MANLGNAWHIPNNPEPRGRAGMREPVGAIVPGMAVTIITGNQFQGAGNPGNQLQTGSALFFKRTADANWTSLPLIFLRMRDNNKYYKADIPADTFQADDVVQYYLRIPYDDHGATFLHANGDTSATTANEATAQARSFTFRVENSAVKGQWGGVVGFPQRGRSRACAAKRSRLDVGPARQPRGLAGRSGVHAFRLEPKRRKYHEHSQPKLDNGTKVNLFCSGHTFLPDGRLLVVGGHRRDSDGLNQATLYDWTTNTWTPTAPMTTPSGEEVRRWYPTATTLPNGNILVLSGSYIDPMREPGKQVVVADLLQIWENGTWKTIRKNGWQPAQLYRFASLPSHARRFRWQGFHVGHQRSHFTIEHRAAWSVDGGWSPRGGNARLLPGGNVRRRQSDLYWRGQQRRHAHAEQTRLKSSISERIRASGARSNR